MAFWKIIFEAPKDESCDYKDATYLLSMEFPATYPQHPPTVRFETATPIKHVNVNAHGRVCHGILGRDYEAGSTKVRDIFDSIYGL